MLKLNAVPTPGPPCQECGAAVPMMYCVMLCNDCLEKRIESKECVGCGEVSKHHPRMSRIQEDGSLGSPRYWCASCAP